MGFEYRVDVVSRASKAGCGEDSRGNRPARIRAWDREMERVSDGNDSSLGSLSPRTLG